MKTWQEYKEDIECNVEGHLNKTELAILELIYKNNIITISELSKKTYLGTTAIENNIKKLKGKDLLKRVGAAKGGSWEVLSIRKCI